VTRDLTFAKGSETQQVEDELIEGADEIWVVSPVEQQLLQKNGYTSLFN
jgi:hypothetical protein